MRIEADVAPLFYKLVCVPEAVKKAPPDAITAKFSMPWCLGIALNKGQVTLRDFEPAALKDQEVSRVAQLVHCYEKPKLSPLQGIIRVQLRDGRKIERAVMEVPGGTARPISDAALVEKFLDCVAHAARPPSTNVARRMAHTAMTLDQQPAGPALFHALYGRTAAR